MLFDECSKVNHIQSSFFLIEVSCGNPPTFANSAKTGTVYTYLAKVTYSCNSGYNPATTTKTCGANKQWSGANLACTSKFPPLSSSIGFCYLVNSPSATIDCVNSFPVWRTTYFRL